MSGSRDGTLAEPDAAPMPDGSIPLLTEIIRLAGDSDEPLPASIEHVDWAGLAHRVRDDVLGRLMQSSDAMLATELHATLATVLERTLRQLGDELQGALTQLMRDLVARAVADEITRLHDEIERRGPYRRPG
ncbi:MAG: hypothetical protein KJZ83_18830 [Burkholderiaceae bacterium]|nr:hypothetical protein [Burkholderiaceae bacterium]